MIDFSHDPQDDSVTRQPSVDRDANGCDDVAERVIGAADPSQPVLTPDGRTVERGTVLASRYLIVEKIGGGAMGVVYKAEDQHCENKPVAIKFIRRQAFTDAEYDRFRHELGTIAHLDQIPGIVQVIDSNLEDTDCPYVVTEYVEGWDLDRFALDKGPTLTQRVQLLADLCDTLGAMHDAGVIHRDLKPTNIRVRRQQVGGRWSPVIVDFGVALNRMRHAGDRPGGFGGTLAFMSPEHGDSDSISPRSDLYALGVVGYWLLSEQMPYTVDKTDMQAILDGRWRPQAQPLPVAAATDDSIAGGVPQPLADIINRALSPRPLDRYQSAEEMAGELRRWLERRAKGDSRQARRWPKVAVVAAMVISIVAITWILIPKDTSHKQLWADIQGLEASPAVELLYRHAPPPAPENAPAPSLDVGLYVRRAGGNDAISLDDGDEIASGTSPTPSHNDLYQVAIRPRTAGYLYVFQVDSAGKLVWLFPKHESSRLSSGKNPVVAGHWIEIPGGHALYLDSNVGLEHVCIALSARRWPDLESTLAQLTAQDVGNDNGTTTDMTRAFHALHVIDQQFRGPQNWTKIESSFLPKGLQTEGATNSQKLQYMTYTAGQSLLRVMRWFRHVDPK